MAIKVSISSRESFGSKRANLISVAYDSSYPTGGEPITAAQCGLYRIDALIPVNSGQGGYEHQYDVTNKKIFVRTDGTTGATTSAGSSHNHAFTGTLPAGMDLATPRFNGTGYATAGQDITTTDNQTMTLNQCAGMWFIADALSSTAPVLIISNTAVTGAPAVLTVIGTAPATDAGTYKIVAQPAPTGTNAAETTHTHTVAAGTAGEVANGTNLSSLTAVQFWAIGD